jgi:antitoxin PrlF
MKGVRRPGKAGQDGAKAGKAGKAKMTSKGQLTVPKAVRKRLGVGPGDELEFIEDGGSFRVRKVVGESPIRKYVGFLKHLKGQDPDEIVREMRGHD